MNIRMSALVVVAMLAPATSQSQIAGNGFLFGRPKVSLTVRGGVASATANSDVFSFAAKQLTLGKNDFGSATFGLELAFNLTPRTALQFSGTGMAKTIGSEFRDYVDNNDLPIEQRTEFRRQTTTVGLKYFLTPPGRSISRLAWVPSRITPYVAAGGGAMWYRFKQNGDFVDFKTLDVFPTTLTSSGYTAMAYGAGGFDFSLTPSLTLNTEARYDAARATMSKAFDGFNRIDLSGLTATAGLSVRF